MLLQGAVTDLQNAGGGGSGVRNVSVLNEVGGSTIVFEVSGNLIYSLNQNPGQIVIDDDGNSPLIGTEYIIYAGDNNTVLLQTFKTSGRIQISGTATNTSNSNVNMAINSKCTVTKITQTLWIVQGDGLTYAY